MTTATTSPTPISNQDIMDTLHVMMNMTSDGFIRLETRMDSLEGRMDKLEGRMDRLETRMDRLEQRIIQLENDLRAVKQVLRDHGIQLNRLETMVDQLQAEQRAQVNDIAEILDRITILEDKAERSAREQLEIKQKLEIVIDWIKLAAKQLNIPLEIA